jgi:hypothetical protein
MSALWPKADMPKNAINVAIGGKVTCRFALQMSASDPKRTSLIVGPRNNRGQFLCRFLVRRGIQWHRPCPCRKLNPYVLMVQSAKHRSTFDAPDALNAPSNGRILP